MYVDVMNVIHFSTSGVRVACTVATVHWWIQNNYVARSSHPIHTESCYSFCFSSCRELRSKKQNKPYYLDAISACSFENLRLKLIFRDRQFEMNRPVRRMTGEESEIWWRLWIKHYFLYAHDRLECCCSIERSCKLLHYIKTPTRVHK